MARSVERPNRYFAFLRRLRAEGRSNMYGAIPYLVAAFGIDRNESFRIVCEWIDAQEALALDAAVPKAGVPAERRAEPTLFDPVRAAEPAAVVQPPRASRAPARKAAARKPATPRKDDAPRAPVKRAAARKKSPPPSGSRAA